MAVDATGGGLLVIQHTLVAHVQLHAAGQCTDRSARQNKDKEQHETLLYQDPKAARTTNHNRPR